MDGKQVWDPATSEWWLEDARTGDWYVADTHLDGRRYWKRSLVPPQVAMPPVPPVQHRSAYQSPWPRRRLFGSFLGLPMGVTIALFALTGDDNTSTGADVQLGIGVVLAFMSLLVGAISVLQMVYAWVERRYGSRRADQVSAVINLLIIAHALFGRHKSPWRRPDRAYGTGYLKWPSS